MERWPAALSSQLRHNGAPVEVLLDASRLAWKGAERSGRARGDPSGDGSHAVQVCEIVAVREAESAQTNTGTERRRSIKNVTKHSKLFPHAFTVSYVRRAGYHRWQCSDITFSCTSQRLCQQWIQSINDQLALLSNRPRSLLVYINPYGGKQLGKWIYEQKVAPLFHHASISADVIVTERANHATDHLKTEANLEKYDGVVCVGGDGMFSEILHGLVSRTQADSGVDQNQPDAKLVPCSLRIGIIPAGSTDCICYATVGANDPVTSALHIIVGDSQPMDVSSVHSRDAFLRYSVSLLGYGFYGDVLADSEKKRWMGPARYDLAGVKTFLGHNYYEGTVSFVPAEDHQGDPRDKRRCRAGCHACQHRPHADDKLWKTPEEKEKSEKDGGGGGVWCAIQGKFVAINAANISCACPRSPEGLSPSAHLADGTTDLILVRRCSRLDFLRHLLRHTNKQDQFDHAFVEVHRVRRFRFQPKHQEALSIEDLNEATRKKALGQLCGPAPVCHGAAAHSSWTCDGEILPHAAIQVSVQSQLIRLFARGIEEQQCVSEDPHTPESPEAMTQHLS